MDQAIRIPCRRGSRSEAYFATKSDVQTEPQFHRLFPWKKHYNQTHNQAPSAPLHQRRVTGSGQDSIKGRSDRPPSVRRDRKSHRDFEAMYGTVSKVIHKTFVSGDRSFKEFSYAHKAPGYSSVSV